MTTLAITAPATLPDATAGTPYAAALTASGGTPEYRWFLVAGPAWLKVGERTGALSGTPVASGLEKATVGLVDESTATVSRTYDLKVTPAPPRQSS